MTHELSLSLLVTAIGRLFEHAAVALGGVMLMVIGLGLGVTKIMLPAGCAIGLLGAALFVWGLFSHADGKISSGEVPCWIDRRSKQS